MTVMLGGFLAALILVVAGVVALFTDVASDRARAQTAADAAALAAVAESAPGESGLHAEAAHRYADANGATLLTCECDPGSTSVVVTVEVDGVEASARATMDPEAFLPADLGLGASDLQRPMAQAVAQLLSAARGRVRLVSGWRSPERQEQLWSAALQRYGDPEVADNWVARPGSSMHERGLAVDLGGDLELAARLVEQLGLPLYRPLPNEPWHFELLGSR